MSSHRLHTVSPLYPPPFPGHNWGNQGLKNSTTFSWGGTLTELPNQVQTWPLQAHRANVLFHLAPSESSAIRNNMAPPRPQKGFYLGRCPVT